MDNVRIGAVGKQTVELAPDRAAFVYLAFVWQFIKLIAYFMVTK